MTRLNAWRASAIAAFVLSCATVVATQAQTFTTAATFENTNGNHPFMMSLVQGADGNLYGTTENGGSGINNPICNPFGEGCGVVFRFTPPGALTAVYNFCPPQKSCVDGAYPAAGLLLAVDGNFYGTTTSGGYGNGGVVFKLTPGGSQTTLLDFCGQQGCDFPQFPQSALIQDRDGNFYGVTPNGGRITCGQNDGCGTLFKMTQQGLLKGFYSFCTKSGCPDGYNPAPGLVQTADGDIYGTTIAGGTAEFGGTVFKITPRGVLTTIYNFCSQPNCTDGAGPVSGLIQGADGNFYGTTDNGGANSFGTLFEITASGILTTLYNFCSQPNCVDGTVPWSVIQGSDGNFYGVTFGGGTETNGCNVELFGCGTVFQITPAGALTTLHSFSDTDGGGNDIGGLLQATNGVFYGTTLVGGDPNCDALQGCGTLFSIDMGLRPFVSFVRSYGKVGQNGGILGQGFTGATSVSLNGIPSAFTVVSDTFIRATVPAGATTGYVTVVTPSGTLKSNVSFRVLP